MLDMFTTHAKVTKLLRVLIIWLRVTYTIATRLLICMKSTGYR